MRRPLSGSMRVEDDVPMSEALYRKYRPQIFEDVVGQEHIERTIKNAIEQDKVSHAYLDRKSVV